LIKDYKKANNQSSTYTETEESQTVNEKQFNDIKFRLLNIDTKAQIDKFTYQDKLKYLSNYSEVCSSLLILKDINLSLNYILILLNRKQFSFKTLKYLNLTKNNLHDSECCIIIQLVEAFSVNLEHLNLSYNRFSTKTASVLSSMIEKGTCKLKSLNINGNNLGDHNFSEFSIGLSKNLYLTKLWLADNNLGKISLIILGTILRYDKKLILLDLSSNEFNDDVIIYIFKGLISNSSLRVIYLNNLGLTKKSVDILETSMYINSCLKELYLENNKLNNKSCEILVRVLNKNRTLDLISLVGNPIDSDGIDAITDNYKQLAKIKYINKIEANQRKFGMLNNNKLELLQYFGDR